MAKQLFSSYPRSDYDDPDFAMAGMVKVLSGYAEGIVREVTSLETGIQRTSKFPPRIAEIVEACDKVAERLSRWKRFQNFGKAQIEERNRLTDGTTPESRAAFIDQAMANFPRETGRAKPVDSRPQSRSIEELAEYYRADPTRIAKLTGPEGTRT